MLEDFYHSVDNRMQADILGRRNVPAFVVSHRAASEADLSSLKKGEFADPEHRMFPIDSKANTWLSIASFNQSVLKTAAASPMTVKAREGIRVVLAKAASMWGLDDDEVKNLTSAVTLTAPEAPEGFVFRKASTEYRIKTAAECEKAIGEFVSKAAKLTQEVRQETGEWLLKIASTVGASLENDNGVALCRHAGLGTCLGKTASTVTSDVLRKLPVGGEVAATVRAMRDALYHLPPDELLPIPFVRKLASSLGAVNDAHFLRIPDIDARLFGIGPAEIVQADAATADIVRLPGGMCASHTAISENAEIISNYLANRHGLDVYTPDDMIKAMNGMSSMELVPLRHLIGA